MSVFDPFVLLFPFRHVKKKHWAIVFGLLLFYFIISLCCLLDVPWCKQTNILPSSLSYCRSIGMIFLNCKQHHFWQSVGPAFQSCSHQIVFEAAVEIQSDACRKWTEGLIFSWWWSLWYLARVTREWDSSDECLRGVSVINASKRTS